MAAAVLFGVVFVAGIWRDVPRGRTTLPIAWRSLVVNSFDIGLASYVMPLPAIVFLAVAVMSARDLRRLGLPAPLFCSLLAPAILAILLVV